MYENRLRVTFQKNDIDSKYVNCDHIDDCRIEHVIPFIMLFYVTHLSIGILILEILIRRN